MIFYVPDMDILKAETEAVVIPTNCVGVMGAGLAAGAKNRFAGYYSAYRQDYLNGKLRVGKCMPFRRDGTPRYVISFPSKYHWRDESQLSFISAALADLTKIIRTRAIRSIAIPQVGCGLGGLDWGDVAPMIEMALTPLSADCEVFLAGPEPLSVNAAEVSEESQG